MGNIKNNKSIDVIIPVYNGEKFIIDAIKSVEAQSFKVNNIYIIDDGSTDNTASIIKDYKNRSNSPINYLYKENGGPNSARNKGVDLSRADFIAFLDGDDIWMENKLKKQIEVFQSTKYSKLGLVYSDYNPIDSRGNIIDTKKIKIDERFRGNAFNTVLGSNKIIGSSSSVLIKREVFSNVGTFDENLRFSEDWDMWIRISEKYQIDYSNEILVNIRRHEKNTTNNIFNSFIGEIDFYNKWTILLGEKTPPIEWKERIVYRLMRSLPDTKLFKILKNKMPIKIREKILGKNFSYIGGFIFLIKRIIIRNLNTNG
jgi:glycosyltransferase involved in cell wall biosynthesis